MDNYNPTQLPVESAEERGYDKDSYQIKGEETGARNPSNYTGVEDPAQFVSHKIPGYGLIGAEASFQSPSCGLNQGVQAPALDYNGYVLYASSQPVPEELMREPTGSSIAEPGAVLDEENGRTYVAHETGKYYLPNDPAEQDRLDLQHKAFTIYLGGALYRAPIGRPDYVLDIATGTGIWAIKFAQEHPQATVIGTDLSMIQPTDVVPNVQFFKEDSEHSDWIHPHPFDYVHLRLAVSCFDDHRTVIRKSFDSLRPGGWIELMDPVFQTLCDDNTLQGLAIGRDLKKPLNYKRWLIEAGFVDVVEEVGPGPGDNSLLTSAGNPWPVEPRWKELGRWLMTNTHRALRGMCWKMLRNYGIEANEVEELLRLASIDVRDTRIHYYYPIYVVCGRKPLEWENEQ
ncbi:hypothetical protein N8I77_012130 [Diaporthe amygdali]|uniref:S-adenosyl-L-methionine-dependent methyltransferase n=1 Tax=Phomopsis amygdali TaxID=1214568 RepID=A0AAD9W0E7_PHOAM|nr:hypothetical protein N8I77_012130 [Diaporthe amygdali]